MHYGLKVHISAIIDTPVRRFRNYTSYYTLNKCNWSRTPRDARACMLTDGGLFQLLGRVLK